MRYKFQCLPGLLLFATTQALGQAGETPATAVGSLQVSGTTSQLFGGEVARSYAEVFPLDKILAWRIHVPPDYDPANPPGVLAYVSPSDSGALPARWRRVMDSENLIWVAADRSGNRTAVARRIAYVPLGISIVDERYALDPGRVYVAGFSGGAKVAGIVAVLYPQMLRGAIYIGGAEFFNEDAAAFDADRMQQNRYVFIAGSTDFNLRLARSVHARYARVGITGIEFLTLVGKGHVLPGRTRMLDAVRFLDGNDPERSSN